MSLQLSAAAHYMRLDGRTAAFATYTPSCRPRVMQALHSRRLQHCLSFPFAQCAFAEYSSGSQLRSCGKVSQGSTCTCILYKGSIVVYQCLKALGKHSANRNISEITLHRACLKVSLIKMSGQD